MNDECTHSSASWIAGVFCAACIQALYEEIFGTKEQMDREERLISKARSRL